MSAHRAPLAGTRLWLAAGILLLAILAGVLSLGTLLDPGPWFGRSAISGTVVAGVTTLLRHLLRSRTAPTVWGTVLAVVVVTAGYGGTGTGWSAPAATIETLERLRLLIAAGVSTINDQAIPVTTTRGLDLLVVVGALVCYLVAEALVLGMRHAGLAGIPILALWTPAALFQKQPEPAVVALGVATFLVLLGLTHRRAPHGTSGRGVRSITTATAALTALTLMVTALTTALPFYGSHRLPSTLGGGPDGISSPLRLSSDLDMRVSLSLRSDEPLLTYVTDGTRPGPLRTHTLTEFDGRQWRRGGSVSGSRPPTGVLWPVRSTAEAEEPAELQVQIHRLDQDRLPITTDPRRLDITGTWMYDPRYDEVMSLVGSTTRDLSYRMFFSPRALTADDLRSDEAGRPLLGGDRFLQIPATEHEADIRALAEEVTADAETDYDRALALQMYLRSATTFTYSTEIPPAESPDAVWDFLQQRRGYCVQFATAMTVMARMLGIPSRMAIGFLPGEPVTGSPRTFQVSGRQAHAWPELHFAEAGWVRFEPTPARQTGAPPIWADPFAGLPAPEEEFPGSVGQPLPAPTTAPPASTGRPGYLSIGDAEVPVPFAGGTLLLVLVAFGAAWFIHLRHRRRDRIPSGPDEWWNRLRQRCAEAGVTWSDAATPRQAARLVRESYRPDENAVDAVAALGNLVGAVENVRYAPVPTDWSTEELETWVDAAHRPLASSQGEARPDR